MHSPMHSFPMPVDPADKNFPGESLPGRDSALGPAPLDPGADIDPPNSVVDYNRIMLQYTQRQMAAFTQAENGTGRRNSGTSRSSGQSNSSSVTNMAGAGTALPPQQTARDTSTQSPGGARA